MDSQTVTLTLPFTAQQFWVFTTALSLIALSAGIVYVAGKRVEKERLPKDWLRDSLMIAGGLLTPIWAALLFMVLSALWHLAWEMSDVIAEGSAKLRWHTLAIVGMITTFAGILGAPLAMIRVVMTERQTRATEEGLITDRINKAVEGLGAVRNIKHQHQDQDGNPSYENREVPNSALLMDYSKPEIIEVTKPNIEVRIGALYSLQRIAEDSPRDRGQILNMLCAYVRENSPAPEPIFSGEERPEGLDAKLRNKTLPPSVAKTDIQTAIDVIGAILKASEKAGYAPDFNRNLGNADLRALRFSGINFVDWEFGKSHFDDANVSDCTFKECRFTNTQWIKTFLLRTTFDNPDFAGGKIVHAALALSKIVVSTRYPHLINMPSLVSCAIDGCTIHAEHARNFSLFGSRLLGTHFYAGSINGVDLRSTQLSGVIFISPLFFQHCYFDHLTTFPIDRFEGFAFKGCELSQTNLTAEHLSKTFGDASVILSGSQRKHVDHWPTETLSPEDFRTQWRAWQRSIGFQPDENQQ